MAVRQGEQQLDRVLLLGAVAADDVNRVGRRLLGHLLAQGQRQVAHLVKARALVQPAKHLLGAEGGLALFLKPLGQLLREHLQ